MKQKSPPVFAFVFACVCKCVYITVVIDIIMVMVYNPICPFTWYKSSTLQSTKAPLTIPELPPYFMFGMIQEVAAFSLNLCRIELSIWPKDFKLWFVSPKEFIPRLYCPVFVLLAYFILLILFCFNSGFLITILQYRPA